MPNRLIFSCLLFFSAALSTAADDPLRTAAAAGDGAAQTQLGSEFFFARNGRRRDASLGRYWFRRAALGGNFSGMYNYAVCLEFGWGGETDLLSAYRLYQRAAKALPAAQFRQALLLYKGIPGDEKEGEKRPGVTADPAAALPMLREAARTWPPARMELARLLLADPKSAEQNGAEIRALAEAAAAASPDDPALLLFLAKLRRDGVGGVGNPAQAADLTERAAKLGSAEAQAELAVCYEYGCGRPVDRKKAFGLICRAAEKSVPSALVRLGDYSLNGEFLPHDPVYAAECYRRAGTADYPPAWVKLGLCYETGIGVEKDPRRAFELYARAARSGDREAALRLSYCYRDGVGITADPGAAKFWFKRAGKSANSTPRR